MTSTESKTSHLRPGIPRVDELDRLKQSDAYREPAEFNDLFLQRHADALTQYGKHWGRHPFRLWSRRWEYPFAADAVLRFAEEQGSAIERFNVMDAGSGVTFFPYYICSRVPKAQFICVDYDPS